MTDIQAHNGIHDVDDNSPESLNRPQAIEALRDSTDDRANVGPVKRVLNVDLSHLANSNMLSSQSSQFQTNYMEELNNREDEIRKMLYETKAEKSKSATAAVVTTTNTNEKNKKKPSTFEVSKTIKDSDEEECTFKPKINPRSIKSAARLSMEKTTNDSLYKEAENRKLKSKESQEEARQSISRSANSNKINSNSMKIMMKRIESALRNLIEDVVESNQNDRLAFDKLGVVLHRLGVFRNLEFVQNPDHTKSSLTLNQSKVKPQRLTREIAFHENLWAILSTTSSEPDFISSEILFRFLMVLVEDKVSVQESAAFLQEITDVGLEANAAERGDDDVLTYTEIKESKGLWDLEKLVSEFRKLFDDKTTFMGIYATNGILPARSTVDEKQGSGNFAPQINTKSKNLDQKNENYREKVKNSQTIPTPDKLQNRYDVLFEHHKYLKGKKNESLEQKLEQELANCTFKPQIKEYKRNIKTPQSATIQDQQSSYRYSQLSNSNVDLSKAKRHDILYDIAKAKKEKLHQKAYEVKKKEENKELSECTFQPKINNRSDEFTVKEPVVTQTAPRGYKKAVERMQVAEKLREEKKAEKEYVPRGENYEKNRNVDFKPPSFLNRPKIKKQEALVYVDVNIGPGKTGRIGIHRGDNAALLAKNFAKTYSLPPIMKDSLEKLLQSYIDSYFPEKDDGEDQEEGDQNGTENIQEEHGDDDEGQEEEEEDGEDEEDEEELDEGEDGEEEEQHDEEEEEEELPQPPPKKNLVQKNQKK